MTILTDDAQAWLDRNKPMEHFPGQASARYLIEELIKENLALERQVKVIDLRAEIERLIAELQKTAPALAADIRLRGSA